MSASTPTAAQPGTSALNTRLAGLGLAMLLAACAEIPKSNVAESQFDKLSCADLAKQTEEAQATKAAADKAKGDSWHAVLPFIVAARYGSASSAYNEAEKRLALLSEQSTRRGCGPGAS